jgi:hypothetical protein
MQTEGLVKKIKRLPSNRIAEVEDFVDFLAEREDRILVRVATKLSENAFEEVWNNEEDSVYDNF